MTKKKPAFSEKISDTTKSYLISLYFTLISLGIVVLAFSVINTSEDIRQQAFSPYPNTPTPTENSVANVPKENTPIPTQSIINEPKPNTPTPEPLLRVIPNNIDTTTPENSTEKPQEQPTEQNNTAPNVPKEPTALPEAPKPQQQPTAATAQTSSSTTPQNQTTTQQTHSNTTNNSTSVSSGKSSGSILNSVGKTVQNIQSNIQTNNATAANLASSISSTGHANNSQNQSGFVNSPLSKTARAVLGIAEGFATKPSEITTQTTSSQHVYKPQENLAPSAVVSKVTQVAAVNAALVNQVTKPSENIQIVVEDQGKFVSHVVKVPKTASGAVDQQALQNAVSQAVAAPQTGKAISKAAIDTVAKNQITSTPAATPTVLNSLSNLFRSKTAREVAKQVETLNQADVIIKTTPTDTLPVKAQQISVSFDQQNVIVKQSSNAPLVQALGQQISPVQEQLKSALNTAPEGGNNSTGKVLTFAPHVNNSVQVPPDLTETVNIAAQTTNSNQAKVIQAATIQALAKQFGAEGAQVEYFSNAGNQTAYVNATQNSINNLKASTAELSNAQRVNKTIGEEMNKFVNSTPLSQVMTRVAFPGIGTVAKQPKFNVQVIQITGDINAQPDLTLNIIKPQLKEDSTTSEAKALIIVDEMGNQKIQLSGNQKAVSLQQQLDSYPESILGLINNTLLESLKNN